MSDLTTVPGLLENAASGGGVVTVLAGEREDVAVGELWLRSERAAARFLETVGPGGAVGLLLETSVDCLVSLLGAWRAGVTTLSLPPPPRSAPPDAYRDDLLDIVRAAGAGLVVLPERLAGLDLAGAAPTASFRECAAHPRRADVADPGEFVQFSSGSTGRRSSGSCVSTTTSAISGLASSARSGRSTIGSPATGISALWPSIIERASGSPCGRDPASRSAVQRLTRPARRRSSVRAPPVRSPGPGGRRGR